MVALALRCVTSILGLHLDKPRIRIKDKDYDGLQNRNVQGLRWCVFEGFDGTQFFEKGSRSRQFLSIKSNKTEHAVQSYAAGLY